MKLMTFIKEFLFGVRAQGEKLPEPQLPKERDLDPDKFYKWCQELRVSSMHGKNITHF